MSRQRTTVLRVLIGASLFSSLCTAQVCRTFDSASAEDAIRSLDRGEIQTSYCTRAAFRLIEGLPLGQAVPILIKHLNYNWPLSNEPHGLRSYPAVEALADLGLAAEPPLIDFVAQHENESNIEHRNALEALAMIHYFDAVPAIRLLRERSLAVAGTPAARRLDSAADYMFKRFCPPAIRKRCEERLYQSDSKK